MGTLIPKEALQIGNSITFHNGGAKVLAYNFFFDGSDKKLIAGRSNALFFGPDNIEFRVSSSGAANSVITWTKPIVIYNNGVSINSSYTAGAYKLYVGGTAWATSFTNGSDLRLKESVEPITEASKIISRLQGRTYFLKADVNLTKEEAGRRNYGFIAQEVEKVLPDLVWNSGDSLGLLSLNYDGIIPFLVEAFKEQQRKVDNLEAIISELRARLDAQSTEGQMEGRAMLSQNRPNPFENNTEIFYTLPVRFSTAIIEVYDMKGVIKLNFPLRDQQGTISITAAELGTGVYVYSLLVDRAVIDSRMMVISNLKE